MSASRDAVKRYEIADYLNIATAEAGQESYELMGIGFKSLDENPNAQVDSTTYVNEKSSSSSVRAYEPSFPFEADTIKSQKAVMALYNVGRNQLVGSDAEFDYVRVELFDQVTTEPASTTVFKARKFRVSAEISSFEGEGGNNVTCSGNLNAVGDFIDGTFDTKTKTFTPTAQA